MNDRTRAVRNAQHAVRTAADVLAEGWEDGDDFEISFIVADSRSTQAQTGRGRPTGRRS